MSYALAIVGFAGAGLRRPEGTGFRAGHCELCRRDHASAEPMVLGVMESLTPSLGVSPWGPVPPTLPYQPELVAKPSLCGNGKQAQAAPYEGVDGPEGGHGVSVIGGLMSSSRFHLLQSSSALALHRRAGRVLELEPIWRRA